MRHLQKLHEKYCDQGLVLLGFNASDDKNIAIGLLRDSKATFLTILDSSDTATKVQFRDYKASGVPLNYVIDRQGKIVDVWYGYEEGHKRALAALKKAGLKIEEAP